MHTRVAERAACLPVRCGVLHRSVQFVEMSQGRVTVTVARIQQGGDPTVLDDLAAEDLVNHAAGPQGRACRDDMGLVEQLSE